MKSIKKFIASLAAVLAVPVLAFASSASALSTVVVTPDNTQGWSTADTRPGGAVNFVEDATAPLGEGALQLTTDATTTAKAQYMHGADGVALSEVETLGYQTKQESGPVHAAASYQLPVCLLGLTAPVTEANPTGCNGFTTLVYEPYQNGTVVPGQWQTWDVDAGQFWSSRTVDHINCGLEAGGGGAPFYTLSELQLACPDAVVAGYGVNIGSNNPGYDVKTDAVVFNDTTYDFEAESAPVTLSSKEECKAGGWLTSEAPVFKNQGQCVSHFARLQN